MGQERRRRALGRVAHGGLAGLYALAAILGLFLHSAGEAAHVHHVCDARHADLERDDAPDRPVHDEAHCALCHTLDRLVASLPGADAALDETLPLVAVLLAPTSEAASAFEVTHRSRAPPASLVVS